MILPAGYKFPRPLDIQPEESRMIAPRDRITVSQHAERTRILGGKESKYPGPYSNELTPFLVEIQDSLCDATTREEWVSKCTQSGVSLAALNWLKYLIEINPGPTSLIFPDEKMTKKRLRTSIKWMFQSNPSLLKFLKTGDIRDLNTGQENDLTSMCLYIAWAGSAVALSGDALMNIILDEAAKHLSQVGHEAGSIALARDRLTTFSDVSKLFGLSSPILVGDMFDREYKNTDQREWWIKCPFCGQRHIPRWEYVKLDRNSAGKFLAPEDYLSGECARYICPQCERKWDEWNRWAAVSTGKWAPRDCKVDPDGKIIGKVFSNPMRGHHISALMLYPGFLTISVLAAEWAKADMAWKAGDKGPKQNFFNSRMGEGFEEREKETDEEKIMLHIGSYEPDIVPHGCQMLTCGIDVQMDHVWFAVDGYGYLSEAWSISEGRIETGDIRQLANWGPVEEFLHKVWPLADDNEKQLACTLTGIDCGNWQDVVIDFCRKMQRQGLPVVPTKGSGTGRYDIYTASKIAGGTMIRYDLNVNNIKNGLYRLLYESQDPGPGYMHLHKNTSPEVIGHLSSEHQTPKKISFRNTILVWKLKTEYKANHLWDAKVIARAMAEIAGVRMLRDPNQPVKKISLAERQKRSREND